MLGIPYMYEHFIISAILLIQLFFQNLRPLMKIVKFELKLHF